VINALSVDLEESFQVSGFEKCILQRDWSALPSRIASNTERVLKLLERTNTRATFFIVGWIAEHHPQVVRWIAEAGHEVACHSYWHRLVYTMTPEEFRQDTIQARAAIESAAGTTVVGYRAPSYSIVRRNQWALDILLELGFGYDSSIFPVDHDRYGWRGMSRFAGPVRQSTTDTLWEFPPSTFPVLDRAVPVAGGGYLRMLPYHYSKWALDHINQQEGRAGCIYFHPWELDPQQPRMPSSRASWWRHSWGISGMERKVQRLLEDFQFAPLGQVLRSLDAPGGKQSAHPRVAELR